MSVRFICREQLDIHYFRIQAVDLSYRPYSATTTLQINVLDINDHAPVFAASNGEYDASVQESVPVGSMVTTVQATDKDIGRNGEVCRHCILYVFRNEYIDLDVYRKSEIFSNDRKHCLERKHQVTRKT